MTNQLSWIDGDIWATRIQHWMARNFSPAKTKNSPRRTCKPLILTGHGSRISVHNGSLLVWDGYTHHPQVRAQYRFFPRDSDLPPRIIIVGGSGNLSFAALDWLSSQNVPLVRLNWKGEVQNVFSNFGYSADLGKVAQQKRAQLDSVRMSTNIIIAKIQSCLDTLKLSFQASANLSISIKKLTGFKRQLLTNPPRSAATLLAIEGSAASAYFEVWQTLKIKWKGTGRLPIPSDWYCVGPRSSIARKKLENRNAMHPVNAMLNYGYAILESQTRLAIISDGLDPTISYLHSEKLDRSGLVLDLMEPFRPVVDGVILEFVNKHIFHPSDFTLRSDGVCRLNPELARQITLKVLEKIAGANSKTGTREIRRNSRREALQLSEMQKKSNSPNAPSKFQMR